jgi:hypothetical protein
MNGILKDDIKGEQFFELFAFLVIQLTFIYLGNTVLIKIATGKIC